jgi:superoxide reductase
MSKLGDNIQTADWKVEKHIPVIEGPDTVKAGEMFRVMVTLGKEIAHPNTTEHHIRWITLYYHAHGEKFNYEVGHFEFNAHGESAEGPNKGPVFTHHEVGSSLKIMKSGTLHAVAFCNIHGLWESSKTVTVE